MPHVSDVRSTSHDRHDPMLVAALAADDLAGIDRDQAIALTRSCPDCATLHDDLVALARATASVPPPIATRPRDFQLTPGDAARLRPSGWRRLIAAAASSRTIFSRPLGVGLATLGLVGLLVGNVQLGSGGAGGAPFEGATSASAAVAPRAAAAPAASMSSDMTNQDTTGSALVGRSAGQAPVPAVTSAAASAAPMFGSESAAGSGLPDVHAAPLGVLPGKSVASQPTLGSPSTVDSVADGPFRPLNLLFGAAVVAGIGLLVSSFVRGRRPA
jgi:hypothetical protein